MSCRTTISTTLLSLSALGLALVSGCAISPDDEATGRDNAALSGVESDADADDDATAPGDEDPVCIPDDPSCASACADGSCEPGPAICGPMDVHTDGLCDLFWGYAWNGTRCDGLSGCECKGNCDSLFQSREECEKAYAPCIEEPVDCNVLAAELAVLLAQAQQCNPAAMGPFVCRTFVPTIGCDAPVGSADSAATKAYLELFASYAEQCPLTDPPCPDPSTVATACVQRADADSAVGGCAIVDDGNVPDNGDE